MTSVPLDRYAAAVLRRRWWVVALATLLMLAMTAGARFLGVTNDYRIMFGEGNPQLAAFDDLESTYTVSNTALIAVAPREGSVFTREALGAIEELTEAAWGAPHSSRVDSLTNYSHSEARGDDLVVEPLVDDAPSLSDADVARVKKIALNAVDIAGRLVSRDGRVGGLVINFVLPDNSDLAVVEITDYLNAVLDKARASHPDIAYYLTGLVVMNRAFADTTKDDIETLTPLVFLIIVAAAALLLRSIWGTVAIVFVLAFAIGTTMGFAGWLGAVLSPTSSGVPIIVMTVAVAHSVHVVATTLAGMSRGLDRNAAIAESLRLNGYPVFLTAITTAIGFLSLNSSDSPPFHLLGNLVAFGVLCAFVYSMTLLPAMLSILPLRARRVRTERPAFFDRFGAFVVARRGFLLWFVSLLAVALAIGIPRNELTDNWTKYFDERYEFRRHTDFVIDNLTSLITLEYSLKAEREGGITEPDYLRAVDAFAQWYRSQPGVSHVQAFPDIMKRLNKNLHGDDPAFYRVAGRSRARRAIPVALRALASVRQRPQRSHRCRKIRHAHDRRGQQHVVPGAARARCPGTGLASRQCPSVRHRGDGPQHRFRTPFPAKHPRHAARHHHRHGPHLAHSDRGLQERAPRSRESFAQFHSRGHELRPVGLSRRPRGYCLLGGGCDLLRDYRGRHDSFSDRISEGPPPGPRRARGRALRLSHRGPRVMDHHRGLVRGSAGVLFIGIRA